MSFYPYFVRSVFHPLQLWNSNHLVQLHYEKEFSRTQFLTNEEIRELQWVRLRRLLLHAYDQCRFYRSRFDQAGIVPTDLRSLQDLRWLPPLEKAEIQDHGREMIAANWPQDDLITNQTGGSTGTPVQFYLHRDRYCARSAATLRHNSWAGWNLGDRAAVIWAAPRDRPHPSWRYRLRDWILSEPIWLDAAALSEEKMLEFFQTLRQYRPTIIQGYTRALVVFANFLQDRGLKMIRPQGIIATAEMLEDVDRTLLEEVFGCPVFNRYGCREVSVIASECSEHRGLHTMAEGLFLEIETPNGPARPGEIGNILVTDLLNLAMPLIRYRIGDLGAWALGRCPCGRGLPRLEKIAGRVTDFLVGEDGRLVSGIAISVNLVAYRPSLGQVQVRQIRQGAIEYRVKPGPRFDPVADIAYLKESSKKYLGVDTEVEVNLVDELPVEPSGKFLFSHSSVTPTWLKRSGSSNLQVSMR